MISKRKIFAVIKGTKQIYEEDDENRYVYYTKMALTYNYDEWYFFNDDKAFRFSEYKKTWWISKN